MVSSSIASAVLTGGVTFGLGDIVAQNLSSKEYSAKDTLIVSSLGCIMNGLILPRWFLHLDNTFGKSMVNKKAIAAKMISDQVCYAPFAISVFVFTQAYLCNVESAKKLKWNDLGNLWLADCCGKNIHIHCDSLIIKKYNTMRSVASHQRH
jgi:hypothetical protein